MLICSPTTPRSEKFAHDAVQQVPDRGATPARPRAHRICKMTSLRCGSTALRMCCSCNSSTFKSTWPRSRLSAQSATQPVCSMTAPKSLPVLGVAQVERVQVVAVADHDAQLHAQGLERKVFGDAPHAPLPLAESKVGFVAVGRGVGYGWLGLLRFGWLDRRGSGSGLRRKWRRWQRWWCASIFSFSCCTKKGGFSASALSMIDSVCSGSNNGFSAVRQASLFRASGEVCGVVAHGARRAARTRCSRVALLSLPKRSPARFARFCFRRPRRSRPCRAAAQPAARTPFAANCSASFVAAAFPAGSFVVAKSTTALAGFRLIEQKSVRRREAVHPVTVPSRCESPRTSGVQRVSKKLRTKQPFLLPRNACGVPHGAMVAGQIQVQRRAFAQVGRDFAPIHLRDVSSASSARSRKWGNTTEPVQVLVAAFAQDAQALQLRLELSCLRRSVDGTR